MRNYLYSLSVGFVIFASGCSDSQDTPSLGFTEKTFDDSNGLELYYNGAEMPGKSVRVKLDGDKATITAFSTFDMSQLSTLGGSGLLPCPGIIPGSPETVWEVPLSVKDGSYSFSGNGETDVCTYSYEGNLNSDKLTISIINPILKNHPLSDMTWRPSPIEEGGVNGYSSLPFFFDWEINPSPEIDIDLSVLLESLTTIPIIPVYNNTAYMSVSQALVQVVRAVAFKTDGNILFTYISTVGGAASIAQTQPNGLQYSVSGNDVIKLYINPLSLFGFILENTSGSTPSDEINLTDKGLFPSGVSSTPTSSPISEIISSPISKALIKGMLNNILPLISIGIPLHYRTENNKLIIYIDTEESLSLLQNLIDTLLQDDDALKAIIEQIKENPQIAPILSDLPKLQEALTQTLLNTTKLQIGFSFTKE